MGREDAMSHVHRLATHLKEHRGGINLDRADCGAEPAETAGKGDFVVCRKSRVVAIGYLFRITVLSQERALLAAELAFDAFFSTLTSPL